MNRRFPDLEGGWRIRRRIAGQGRFEGFAEVGRLGGGRFRWREDGLLRLDAGVTLRAHRTYVYEVDDDLAAIVIIQADGARTGSLLHRFEFSPGAGFASHTHPCDPDVYTAKLFLGGTRRFQLSYRVVGPRKRYVMSSAFLKTVDATGSLAREARRP